jgi:hypothetical protein
MSGPQASMNRAAPSTVGRRAARAAPWLAILLITGTVQFVRDAPWDGVIFLTVAAVLAVDVVRPLPSWPRPRVAPKPVARLVVWVIVAAAGLLLVVMPRHSVGEGIVAVAIGLTALVFAWPARPVAARIADDGTLRRTGILWAMTALAVCVWELASFVLGRTMPGGVIEHPAVSDLIDPLLDVGSGHALFAAAWLAFGALLVVPWRGAPSGERI